jgi:hypothetical protein
MLRRCFDAVALSERKGGKEGGDDRKEVMQSRSRSVRTAFSAETSSQRTLMPSQIDLTLPTVFRTTPWSDFNRPSVFNR